MQIKSINTIDYNSKFKSRTSFLGTANSYNNPITTKADKTDITFGVIGALVIGLLSIKSVPTIQPKTLGVILNSLLAGFLCVISSNLIRNGQKAKSLGN